VFWQTSSPRRLPCALGGPPVWQPALMCPPSPVRPRFCCTCQGGCLLAGGAHTRSGGGASTLGARAGLPAWTSRQLLRLHQVLAQLGTLCKLQAPQMVAMPAALEGSLQPASLSALGLGGSGPTGCPARPQEAPDAAALGIAGSRPVNMAPPAGPPGAIPPRSLLALCRARGGRTGRGGVACALCSRPLGLPPLTAIKCTQGPRRTRPAKSRRAGPSRCAARAAAPRLAAATFCGWRAHTLSRLPVLRRWWRWKPSAACRI